MTGRAGAGSGHGPVISDLAPEHNVSGDYGQGMVIGVPTTKFW
jgi:hypothetical protein